MRLRPLADSYKSWAVCSQYFDDQNEGAIKLIRTTENDDGYVTYCVQEVFANLPRNKQTVIGLGNTILEGCTVLAIVSARAVYMVSYYLLLDLIAAAD